MRITVNHEDGGPSIVESDEPIKIAEVLERLDIASSTVLAVLGETIVPHSSMITDDIEIELIVVSSGG
jgi:sulfur carrier protein ThiS|tara:strand:+ start:62 stop:265 length:204 start_codon:yes stop_codon:yes gene_type:complete